VRSRALARAVLSAAALIAVSAGALGGCAFDRAKTDPPIPNCATGKCRYVGVAAVRASALPTFEHATGVKPTMVESYMTFGTSLDSNDISAILSNGAMPLVQLNPFDTSLAAIADGQYDAYLKALANEIQKLGHPIVLSFAAEANGTWYRWSCTHTSAAIYVAAFKHVHFIMSRYDKSIIWMWDINILFPGSCPIAARWPGSRYVDWIGVDGYLRSPGDTFATTMAPTFTAIRNLSNMPILIAETGVPNVPAAGPWLASIFAGTKSIPGVIGLVYFNYQTAKYDYRLEQDPSALAIFRREAKDYESTKSP
jgi:hypothetical protein